ncbi:endonuclease domain-containing protein [Hyphomonas oceanitis]|uniref:endonuclease domain-containing protein n=1 Tax=Hyphomonas oceanitis TaxID=81033 RepID=UPI0030011699
MTRNLSTPRARTLRQSSNAPEDAAWQALRQLRAQGFPVRRQHPINGMIVDFAITKARLVIEIDGGVHKRPDVQTRDRDRDARLSALGWDILRIPAQDVFDPDHLVGRVQEKLGL